jgi:V8-like Glu-specific endopeptidase
MLSAQEHLQEARQRLRLAAAAAAAEAQQPPLLLSEPLEDITAADVTQQQQQRRRLAAAAAEIQEPALEGMEDDAWATAELEAAAAIQQGLWSSSSSSSDIPTSSSSRANGSVVVPASIHRMLSVIKPDNRLPCPVKSFPYYAMGQIKAKASDGGFVCSGGLIGSNRVLTAGHCVWDDRNAQGPFKDLRFAPGQWKVSVGGGLGCRGFVMLFEGGVE